MLKMSKFSKRTQRVLRAEAGQSGAFGDCHISGPFEQSGLLETQDKEQSLFLLLGVNKASGLLSSDPNRTEGDPVKADRKGREGRSWRESPRAPQSGLTQNEPQSQALQPPDWT